MKFKEGDKVKLVRMEDENIDLYKKYLGQEFEIATIMPNTNPHCTLKGNINISPYLKNLELVKDYTYEDLKKSPIGTKITFENGLVLVKVRERDARCDEFTNGVTNRNTNDLKNLKDSWLKGYFGKIIKIEEPEYRTVYEYKPEILDEAEKRYLRNFIRPFKDKVTIVKKYFSPTRGKYYIQIRYKEDTPTNFPYYDNDTMYKGMKKDKEYTLEELGL